MSNQENKTIYTKKDKRVYEYAAFILLFEIIVGSWFFHIIEKWNWLDSVYFVIVTIATVGYGNLVPATDIGKIGNIVLIVTGIAIFGVFINQMTKKQAMRHVKRLQKKIIKNSKLKF